MKSYGVLSIQDGFKATQDNQFDQRERRGFVRYVNHSDKILGPNSFEKSQNIKTFTVDLYFIKDKYILKNSVTTATNFNVEYNKQFKRVSGKNTLDEAASFISPYAGCDETKKLRRRLIALERIHNSVSDESFRFPIINEI